MSNATSTVIIPTNPADLKAIKSAVTEGTNCLLRIDAERDLLKDIVADIVEKYELPKAYVAKMIRHTYAADFDKKAVEFDDFQALFSAVSDA